ncbi:C39 family peptidase [Patescibacteria group bacterium]|nr:C39 family peptidase [Patescibacteria group bacterium]MBU1922168.1 C39 family peptidase [Patescibacteria group bacterium]
MQKIKVAINIFLFILVIGAGFFVLPICRAEQSEVTVSDGVIRAGERSWQAFPNWRGSLSLVIGDLNADGSREIVVAPGAGGGPHVRIFSFEGRLLGQFNAYASGFRGGVNLAVGDVNSDGRDEIVTGAGPGGGPHVRIFDGAGQVLNQWFAYSKWMKSGVLVQVERGQVVTSEQDVSFGFEMPVPFHRQEHRLSCEIASLTSVLLYKGVDITESELIGLQPQAEPMEYKNGIWGDPSKGYVGDIDASQPLMTGYGVYWEPIAEVAVNFRPAHSFRGADWEYLKAQLLADNALVVWGNLYDAPLALIWQTPEGAEVLGFRGEHAYMVIGWQGDSDSPDRVILMDPLRGRRNVSFDWFLRNWSFLGNSGVVVE